MTPSEEFLQIQREMLDETRRQRAETQRIRSSLEVYTWVVVLALLLTFGLAFYRQ